MAGEDLSHTRWDAVASSLKDIKMAVSLFGITEDVPKRKEFLAKLEKEVDEAVEAAKRCLAMLEKLGVPTRSFIGTDLDEVQGRSTWL